VTISVGRRSTHIVELPRASSILRSRVSQGDELTFTFEKDPHEVITMFLDETPLGMAFAATVTCSSEPRDVATRDARRTEICEYRSHTRRSSARARTG